MAREEGRKGRGGQGGKGRTTVLDCESAKVATLKCGGPLTMLEENRGPLSKKFENRWIRDPNFGEERGQIKYCGQHELRRSVECRPILTILFLLSLCLIFILDS